MALKKRKFIDKVEILVGGNIQIRDVNEIYNDPGGEIESRSYDRSRVIAKGGSIPADVKTFIANSIK